MLLELSRNYFIFKTLPETTSSVKTNTYSKNLVIYLGDKGFFQKA